MKSVNVMTKEKSVKETGKATARKAVAKTVAIEKEAIKQEKDVQLTLIKPEPVQEKVEEKKVVIKKAVEKKELEKQMKEVQEEVFVQYGSNEVLTAKVVEKVKAAYIAEGHKADTIEKIRVYIKPEENMVYYVVNDEYASGINLL